MHFALETALLVVLHRQNIIAPLSDDFLDHFGLAAQRIHGHDAALEDQRIQQRLDRRQFVALARRAFLSQRYAQRRSVVGPAKFT